MSGAGEIESNVELCSSCSFDMVGNDWLWQGQVLGINLCSKHPVKIPERLFVYLLIYLLILVAHTIHSIQ